MTTDERIQWFRSIGYEVLGTHVVNSQSTHVTLKRKWREGVLLVAVHNNGVYHEVKE